ncbi:uncharacterized protein B0H18DRAFT_1157227 [Fomitopsis serialis]|uniref:uncharacterized protein n=1 Tax=Fomitopsis serialis TaxID=139415 RepID=UPI002008BFA0|nr:uncharacterized protein B0H18DRAFT_1157227 [Neoantrodia serialis]KAH9912494.1 hypothetical protein B0H18DRAFT_1157227 [Neoantrodia serialis]
MSLNADFALKMLPMKASDGDGLYLRDDTVDIVDYSHILRLQLVASSMTWSTSETLTGSVQEFWRRIAAFRGMASLDNVDRMSLVNAVIYVATRVIDPSKQTVKPNAVFGLREAHSRRSLDVLADLLLHNPGMAFPPIRQICWALAVLSIPESRRIPNLVDFHLLITQLRGSVSDLTKQKLLPIFTFTSGHIGGWQPSSSILHLMLALLENILYETQLGHATVELDEDPKFRKELLEDLVTNYPTFLRELSSAMIFTPGPQLAGAVATLNSTIWSPVDLLRMLRRIVRISGCIRHSYSSPGGIVIRGGIYQHTTTQTRNLLQDICTIRSEGNLKDWEQVYGVAYSAACKFALLDCGQEIIITADSFVFDDYSPVRVAEAMDQVLESASAIANPPETVRTVLTMMAGLKMSARAHAWGMADSGQLSDSAQYAARLLSCLRDPSKQQMRTSYLASLQRKGLHYEAEGALGSVVAN